MMQDAENFRMNPNPKQANIPVASKSDESIGDRMAVNMPIKDESVNVRGENINRVQSSIPRGAIFGS